jgi:serine/threonine protein kinase
MQLTGDTVAGYRIITRLGMGGMSTVYVAYDARTDRQVAISVMRREFLPTPEFRATYLDEQRFLERIFNHPNIPHALEHGEIDGLVYSVKPFLDGVSLACEIERGPVPLPEATRITLQIASALDHIHEHGIIHRDVHPGNILVDSSRTAYLLDFGRAVPLDARYGNIRGFFTEEFYGQPGYAPPESFHSNKSCPGIDVYSLAVVLYEMITGKQPFAAREPMIRLLKQAKDPLPMPRELRPDLPERAQHVLLKALDRDPGARYETAGQLATAFNKAIQPMTSSGPELLPSDSRSSRTRTRPIRLFISFAEADRDMKEEFIKHLAVASHAGEFELWSADHVQAGGSWRHEIEKALNQTDAALLLISADFLASDVIRDVHLPVLLARRESESLPIIPILLRASLWQHHPHISSLKPLPERGSAIASQQGPARDETYVQVARGILHACAGMMLKGGVT